MKDDLDRIMEIMTTAFDPQWGEAWNRRQVADSLCMPNIHYTLVGADGLPPGEGEEAVGFTLVRAAPGEEELLLVAVDPRHRGQGLGRILLERFIADAGKRGADRVFLEMRYNNPAEKIYNSAGFQPIGRRREYYRLPNGKRIDAITFRRDIPDSI